MGSLATAIILTGALVVVIYSIRKRSKKIDAFYESAPTKAITSLDFIASDNRRYLGKESTILHAKIFLKEGTPERDYELLCKTNSGSYFVLSFRTIQQYLKIQIESVSPIDEDSARQFVKNDIEIYSKLFGEPEVA